MLCVHQICVKGSSQQQQWTTLIKSQVLDGTAKDSFHGTAISLIQHASHTHGGLDRGAPVLNQESASKSVALLPSAYTSVPPAALKTKIFTAPGWEAWKAFLEVIDAFIECQGIPGEVSDESTSLLERFVVFMYDRISDIMEVNDTKKQLFAHKARALENIPPTQAALRQHIKRARYQANIWNQSLVPEPELLDPSDMRLDKGHSWMTASVNHSPRRSKVLP